MRVLGTFLKKSTLLQMVSTTPQDEYKNAIVLYHWRRCGHCVRLMPVWKQVVDELPSSIKVFELEVQDSREQLDELGVDLGGGVPRIVAYNQDGDDMVYTGPRTKDEMVAGLSAHLLTVSPSVVKDSYPATVLYFRHSCGYCARFLPEFTKFASMKNVGNVFAVDTTKHPSALKSLSPPATSVPHVVHYDRSGTQRVFKGERTRAQLKSFATDTGSRGVSFEGGNLIPVGGNIEARLAESLNSLQDRAADMLGLKYDRTFEPENAVVCFIGKRTGSNPEDDRVYILLCPHKIPRGRSGVLACMYGSRRDSMTVKIYVGKHKATLINSKRKSGFHPVPETNPNVQALETFGYHVELS